MKKAWPKEPKGNVARYLNTLATMISGIIGSNSSQLPKMASNVPDINAKPASVEKRMKRWLINDNISVKEYLMPFAAALLRNLGLPEIVLAIDGSVVGRGCVTLMVSVIYKKRALPLGYIVVEGKKGHLPEDCHLQLLECIYPLIPENTGRVVLLGDGEFDGIRLQEQMEKWGWKYVCRTAVSNVFFIEDEPFTIGALASMLPQGFYNKVKNVKFTHRKYGPVTLIAWWEEGHKEPLYLVSNFTSGKMACNYYEKRFRIETFFSDQKSRGFNIHKSHLSDPERLARLLIASCIAYIWIIFLGTFALNNGWVKIIHRKDRCDLSLFQLGLRLLEYFLDHDRPFPVSFAMITPPLE